jgi:hypothetical protein
VGFRRPVAADAALAAFFDHDLLASAMAEALAHGARLDAWLQRQGFCRDTQSLVARRFGINHSAVLISFVVRHRTRRWSVFGARRLRRPAPIFLFEHDPLGKAVSTFPDHALARISDTGGLVVVGHPVSDQQLAARQERLARRAREQGSMYHI